MRIPANQRALIVKKVDEYAVVPVVDFEKLVEDAEMLRDITAYDAAKKDITNGKADFIPADMVRRMLLEESNPIMEWRKHRGMTQAAFAEKVGVQQAAIAQYEGGKREPAVKVLKKLAEALHVDLDDLA